MTASKFQRHAFYRQLRSSHSMTIFLAIALRFRLGFQGQRNRLHRQRICLSGRPSTQGLLASPSPSRKSNLSLDQIQAWTTSSERLGGSWKCGRGHKNVSWTILATGTSLRGLKKFGLLRLCLSVLTAWQLAQTISHLAISLFADSQLFNDDIECLCRPLPTFFWLGSRWSNCIAMSGYWTLQSKQGLFFCEFKKARILRCFFFAYAGSCLLGIWLKFLYGFSNYNHPARSDHPPYGYTLYRREHSHLPSNTFYESMRLVEPQCFWWQCRADARHVLIYLLFLDLDFQIRRTIES